MPNFAVLKDNLVVNVIVTDDKEQGERDLNATLVEVTQESPLEIGWTYDPATGTFTTPIVE